LTTPQETYAGIVRGGQPNPGNSGNCGASSHPEYYEEMGIKPPKGVILYGPPGTGTYALCLTLSGRSANLFELCISLLQLFNS